MSDWQVNEGGRMRLVALSPDADGTIRAALQIEPNPGWITYWREPGQSGIPPMLTPAPDSGISLKTIGFPAPKTITIGDIGEIGYDGPVTLPLSLQSSAGVGSAKLDMTAFIGLCKDICIPFQASLSLSAASSTPEEKAIVDAATASLPKPPSADFSIQSHQLSADGKTLSLNMTLPEPTGEAPRIYVTGPSGYAFFKQENGKRDGKGFATDIAIGKLPKTYSVHGKSWGVVVVDGERAMETTLAFD